MTDVDGVEIAANTAHNFKPDATPHTNRETLSVNSKHLWNQGSIISIARPCTYIKLNHVIDFISSHKIAGVNRDELTQLEDMEQFLIR